MSIEMLMIISTCTHYVAALGIIPEVVMAKNNVAVTVIETICIATQSAKRSQRQLEQRI